MEYEIIRREFHDLQNTEQLTENRITTIQVVHNGRVMAGAALPDGFNGVSIYRRKNGTLICEEAFLGGAVDGYARYYNAKGELVGEDLYERGGVTQTRVFQ